MTIVEGEVIEARDLDLLPPSKDEKLAAMSSWTPEQQVEHVTELLVGAHASLLVAIAAQDLPGIVEAKQKAATIQEITKQLRMGKDMRLHSEEFVRRAERGLGVAIRDGQERGLISSKTNGVAAGPRSDYERNGKVVHVDRDVQNTVKSPTDFASPSELSGQHRAGGIYAMTDGVSNEAFEEAIAEARAEENLSRANVARKAKAKSEPASALNLEDPRHDENVVPEMPAAQAKRRLTKHDSVEMLANINGMLNGIVETLPFIDPTEVDFSQLDNRRVIENIRQSMSSIRKLLKEIEHG